MSITHSSSWWEWGQELRMFSLYLGERFLFPFCCPSTGSLCLDHSRQPSCNLSSSTLRWSQCQGYWVKRGREPGSLVTSLSCWLCWALNLLCLWSNKYPYSLSQFEVKISLICSKNHPNSYIPPFFLGHKYLLNTYYVPGNFLRKLDSHNPYSYKIYSLQGKLLSAQVSEIYKISFSFFLGWRLPLLPWLCLWNGSYYLPAALVQPP